MPVHAPKDLGKMTGRLLCTGNVRTVLSPFLLILFENNIQHLGQHWFSSSAEIWI